VIWKIAIIAAAAGLSAFVGWIIGDRRARGGTGAILGLVLGPIGWLIAPRMPSLTRCRHCGRWTPWYPMPPGSGTSHPHLRCRRCDGYAD
jgi:hypothetical protein